MFQLAFPLIVKLMISSRGPADDPPSDGSDGYPNLIELQVDGPLVE